MTTRLRHRSIPLVTAAVATVLVVSPASSGTAAQPDGGAGSARSARSAGSSRALAPDLAHRLDTMPASGRTRVVVTLRGRTDTSTVPNLGRRQRLAGIVARLRSDTATRQGALRTRLRALESAGEVSDETPLWVTNAVTVTASPKAVRELAARPDVLSVTPDAITVTPTATSVEPNISVLGAPQLWSAGRTGRGAVVAVLDSGVDLNNPDLAARWRGGSNSWFDPYGQHASPADVNGHGTMTTGLVVGDQDAGTSYGVAPGASWIAARVFADNGSASATAIHQAFQWVLDPDHDPATADAPQVVNGSWVLGSGPGCDTSFQPDVQALKAAGIVPVFAAGNFGTASGTSASPANYPESLAVGAITATDTIWSSSSNGPTTCGGRTATFPDVVAPGSSVLVADLYDGYTYASGTSIAAPHVAGALALLLDAHPGAPVATLEDSLRSTAHDLGAAGPDTRFGWGRIDVPAASAAIVDAPDFTASLTPASATVVAGGGTSFGVTVSPVNGYAAPTSLTVSGLPTGVSGSFSPSALATGAWSSTLAVTTTGTVAPGTYPFAVTASGGGLTRSISASLTVTAAPDFSVGLSPASLTAPAGGSASTSVLVSPKNAYATATSLSVSGLPSGASASLSATTVVPGAWTSTLKITTSTSLAPGTYPFTVTASGGGLSRSVSGVLSVTPAPNFSLTASPTSRTVQRSRSASFTLTATPTGGFSGPVALSRSALPSGATSSWSINPIQTKGSSTLTVRTSSKTPRGTYRITVTGSSGGKVHTVVVTLVVT